jgi:hypothetical protein
MELRSFKSWRAAFNGNAREFWSAAAGSANPFGTGLVFANA